MPELMDEIRYDLAFIRSHSLQPKWWKVSKVFVLLGFLLGHYLLFGLKTTGLFFALFILLSTFVHLVYRAKTSKYTQSWLDFVVTEEGDGMTPKRIGRYYYSAIVVNTLVALAISHLLT
jgi:hypothetical protein